RRKRAPLQRRGRGRSGADGRARPGAGRVHCPRPRDRHPGGALPRDDRRRVVRPRPAGGGRRMTALARVYRWEIAKLLAQKRTYLGLGTAIAVPIIFVVVLVLQR